LQEKVFVIVVTTFNQKLTWFK